MRNYSMSEREAAAKILPKNRKDRRTIWLIGGFIVLIAAFLGASLIVQHRRQHEIDATWQRAMATVEDVRPVVVSQVNNDFGSAMLYQMEVLARYNANGIEQKRWVRIEKVTRSSPDKSQIARWKGQQFVVRWKASQPDQVVPELN